MRIGIIGLGNIAEKAYLPVVTVRTDVDIVFCSRNRERLEALARTYRVREYVSDVDALLERGVDAAFVHTATESHPAVVQKLLRHGVHVYVDKPIAYTLEESERLVKVAREQGRLLMTGFNRRFAPMYRRLLDEKEPYLVLMQKHRVALPDYARRVVFDDFIHVVDTLRVLAPPVDDRIDVSLVERRGMLHQVLIRWDASSGAAVGLMNRDSGITEEKLQVIGNGERWEVNGLNTTLHAAGGEEKAIAFPDWDSVLLRRGFPQIVDHFLECVRNGRAAEGSGSDALVTHAMCERVVQELESHGAAPWRP